jgi:hypothetical protein
LAGDTIPEFLGGVPKTAATVPAPLSVLLFLGGHYFAALLLMRMIAAITGYIGMYLLAEMLGKNRLAAAMAGVLFAYLPIYAKYGLTHFGLPLLVWFFLQMKEGRHRKLGIAYALLYALDSSLVLAGYAVVGFLALWIVYEWKKGVNIKTITIAWASMVLAYLLTNLSLIGQVLGLTSLPPSHKTDYVLRAEPFWPILLEGFANGRERNASYHPYICAAAVLVLLLFWCFQRRGGDGERRRLGKLMTGLLAFNFLLALIAALYNAAPGIWLRNHMAVLGTVQLSRVLALAPTAWYLLYALLAAFVLLPAGVGKKQHWLRVFSLAIVAAATVLTAFALLKASDLKPNLQKILTPPYPEISYSDYYALGVMNQVEDFIKAETGLNMADYRVVSLGVNPAAALYHGFYCLDGYSNNYPLDYKYAFRRVIAPELAKDEINREYYDYWGNRVYLFSSENDGQWPIKKGRFVYQDFQIDAQALRELGGRYLLSAAYIENATATGLRLMRAEPFATKESWVEIYLYEIN